MYFFRCIIPNDRKICLYNNITTTNTSTDDIIDDDYGEHTIIKYQDKHNDIQNITLYDLGVRHNFTYTKRLVFLQESHYRNCYLNSLNEDCCDCDLLTLQGIENVLSNGLISNSVIIKYIDDIINYGLFADDEFTSGIILGEYVGLLVPFSAHDKPSGYGMNYPCGDDSYEINAYDFGNVIRFINHSTTPNCDFRKVFYEGLVHIVCTTISDIKKGEQMTVNYGASYWLARHDDSAIDL